MYQKQATTKTYNYCTSLLINLVRESRRGIFNPYIDSLLQAAVRTAFWDSFRSEELFPDYFSPH